MHNADVRQRAIAFRIVEPVPDHPFVRDAEADEATEDEEEEAPQLSAREELEHRLAEARARRRDQDVEELDEEPVA